MLYRVLGVLHSVLGVPCVVPLVRCVAPLVPCVVPVAPCVVPLIPCLVPLDVVLTTCMCTYYNLYICCAYRWALSPPLPPKKATHAHRRRPAAHRDGDNPDSGPPVIALQEQDRGYRKK